MSADHENQTMGRSERWVEAIARNGLAWAGLLVVVTALGIWGALRVGVDNSVEIWFLEDDPALQAYRDFQDTFGNDEVVAVGLGRESSQEWLDVEGIQLLHDLDSTMEEVDGIEGADGIIDTPTITGDGFELRIGPAIDPNDWTEEGVARATERIVQDPQFEPLLNEDQTATMVVAQMEAMDNIDAERDGVLLRLRDRLAEWTEVHVALGGIGVIYAALNEASTVGAAGFIAGSYLLITVLLVMFFGRLGAVALTLGTVGLGATWLVGLYGLWGRDINMVTMVMPTLVLVIGVSDCVHMLSHIAEQNPGLSRAERVRRGVGFVFWPCLFNTLTTAAGFLALTSSAMPVVRDLGIFCAVGLVVAFVLSLVLCSILGGRSSTQIKVRETGPVQSLINGMTHLAVHRSGLVISLAAVMACVAALGVTRIQVDTYSIDYLDADHPVRVDSDWIEAELGPYTPLEFVVSHPDGVDTPEMHRAIADWQDRMEAELDVGWTRSATDVYRQTNMALEGSPSEYRLPEDNCGDLEPEECPSKFEMLRMLYESDEDHEPSDFVSNDGMQARVTVGIPMGSAKAFGEQIERLSALERLPEGASVEASGYLPLYVKMMDYIVKSQLMSFALAFVLVFGLVALLFRSVRMSVLALPANLIPVLMTLGLMGLLGIRLDVATVTISAIVLGLVVDDTTQFLYRFRHESQRHESVTEAVSATIQGVGRPMTITTIVLGLGFTVLGFAAIKSVAWFGILLATALFSALISDLLVIPALLVALDRSASS